MQRTSPLSPPEDPPSDRPDDGESEAEAAASERRARRARRLRAMLPLLLAGAISLAYARSFQGVLHFDDRWDIERTAASFSGDPPPILAMLRGRTLGEYDRRPFADLTLVLNQRLGGDTFGYHLVNLGVHLCVALVLYGLVRRTLLLPRFTGRFEESAPTLAFAIALVFGVHPLTTQAVTYVVQRSEALMALFFLLVLYGLLRAATAGRAGLAWVALVWLAGMLGAASKEVMVSAPLVALLYDWVFLRGAGGSRRRLAAHAGLWVVVLGFLTYAGLFAHALFPEPGRASDMGLGFAGVTPWRYLLTQCQVVLHYLRLALWPSGLVIDYGWRFVASPREVWPEGLVLLVLLAASVVLLVRRHWSGFCGLAFFLILAPTSSFLPIADAAFEHRMYLPLAALVSLAVGVSLELLLRLLGDEAAARRGLMGLWLFAAAALALATNARNAVYRSEEALWADAVAKRPDNARALANLSKAALDRAGASAADAEGAARRSVELDPQNPKAFYNLGLALERQGDVQGAREAYERSLSLDPGYLEAHVSLGMLLFTRWSDAPSAVKHLQLALRMEPDNALVRFDMGFVQQGLGNFEQAIGFYDQALAQDPRYLPSAIMKALCLESLGRLDEAEATLRATLARADPVRDRVELVKLHTNLGSVLFQQQRFDEAATCYERALAVDPEAENLQVVWHNLGMAREALGQRSAAVAAYRQVLALAPDHAEAKAALARLGG